MTIDKEFISRSEHNIRPDKFLERHDGYCDILDLKRPDSSILVIKQNRNHSSAKLTEAEAQVDTYVIFVKEPCVRDEFAKKDIKVLSPKGIILMGRSPSDGLAEWEDIKNRLCVSVYTYDDLISEIETTICWIEKIINISTKQA